MIKAHDRELADRWRSSGCSPEHLVINDRELMALCCWCGSDGAQGEGVDGAIAALEEASTKAMDRDDPGWFDRLLSTRHFCERCGES